MDALKAYTNIIGPLDPNKTPLRKKVDVFKNTERTAGGNN